MTLTWIHALKVNHIFISKLFPIDENCKDGSLLLILPSEQLSKTSISKTSILLTSYLHWFSSPPNKKRLVALVTQHIYWCNSVWILMYSKNQIHYSKINCFILSVCVCVCVCVCAQLLSHVWLFATYSRGSSRPRDLTHVSWVLHWQADSLPLVPPGKSYIIYESI